MTAMPQRIQRRRTKGWRMPPGAIYVGRPTIRGNPVSCTPHRCALKPCGCCPQDPEPYCCVIAYREWLVSGLEGRPAATGLITYALDATAGYPLRDAVLRSLPDLRGHDLACWCNLDRPCHADVLLELANV